MEFNKINNLLGDLSDKLPRFVTKKWIEIHPQSSGNYDQNKKNKI